MCWFYFLPSPAPAIPRLSATPPGAAQPPCTADMMTTRRNEIRNLKEGCGRLVIGWEEGEEKQDPSLIPDFIL